MYKTGKGWSQDPGILDTVSIFLAFTLTTLPKGHNVKAYETRRTSAHWFPVCSFLHVSLGQLLILSKLNKCLF